MFSVISQEKRQEYRYVFYPGTQKSKGFPPAPSCGSGVSAAVVSAVKAAVVTTVEAAAVKTVEAAAVKTAVEGAVVAGKAVHESAALCSVVSAFPMPSVMSCVGSAGL